MLASVYGWHHNEDTMHEHEAKQVYVEHPGTVRVSGASEAVKVAKYVALLLSNKVPNVELLFIGANAGQQAFKACSIVSDMMMKHQSIALCFTCHRFVTDAAKRGPSGIPLVGEQAVERRDAFVWRVIQNNSCTPAAAQ